LDGKSLSDLIFFGGGNSLTKDAVGDVLHEQTVIKISQKKTNGYILKRVIKEISPNVSMTKICARQKYEISRFIIFLLLFCLKK
jgi:hypothetical protein